ncbi:MAG TPA: hypothetical protein OIM60_03130 [Clostridiaceae bacterium]|nr:hypothetical protein [Clostridiaceae bacterium]
MNKLKEMLLAKQTTLRGVLGESREIQHPLGNGDNSEGGWKAFLKQILPQKYGIDNGYVIDYEGNVSDQIDIIIYDNLYSPYVMSSGSGVKYIPAEAVYAIIEVKPTITKSYLQYANDKVESVKKLKRTTRGVTVAGIRTPKRELTNILGIILAKESSISRKETVKNHLKNLNNINLVCALDKYTILCNRNSAELEINITNDEEALLGLYFYLNNELYELGTVAGIDIRKYANTLDSFNFNTEEDFRTNE